MLKSLILSQTNPAHRYLSLDVLRGVCLLLMIIFHFGYDLSIFGYTTYDTNADIEWRVFRAIIVSGFLLAVGMSSYLAYHRHIDKTKLIKNLLKLISVSLLISLGSYYMYPQHWVYFGIIHFVSVALPLSLLFVRRPNIALLVAGVIIVGYFGDILSLQTSWEWSVEHIGIPQHTIDLVSFIPWFGVVLLGIAIIHHKLLPVIPANAVSRFMARMGRHSLLIYLIHQPILFSGFYLIQRFNA